MKRIQEMRTSEAINNSRFSSEFPRLLFQLRRPHHESAKFPVSMLLLRELSCPVLASKREDGDEQLHEWCREVKPLAAPSTNRQVRKATRRKALVTGARPYEDCRLGRRPVTVGSSVRGSNHSLRPPSIFLT